MEQKKALSTTVIVISLICIVACFAGCLYALFTGVDTARKISMGVRMVVMAAAAVYFLGGFGKKMSKFFKIYMLLYAFDVLTATLSVFSEGNNSFLICLCAASLGSIVTLALGKDLGRGMSFTLCGIILACALAEMLVAFGVVPNVEYGTAMEATERLIVVVSDLVLALIACVMTVFKYVDKARRGRK